MRKTHLFTLMLIAFSICTWAQQKQIQVTDIYQGEFRTEGMDALRSMNNGTQYTVLNINRNNQSSTIDKYDYKTLEKIATIVSSADLVDIPFFSAYSFSADEKKILLSTEVEPIFRRSSLGVFYVYDIESKNVVRISDTKIQEPMLSPNGKQVAYVRDNNIYIFDVTTGATKQVTVDGVKNKIINGVTDWVYEEEFAFVRAFEWNSDGSKIAFLRFDETNVPEFSMDVYGTGLYQQPYVFKYPKAGENNSIVTLHLLDVASSAISQININNAYYVPRIKWKNHKDMLSVQTLNRHQNHLTMYTVNAKNAEVSVLLEEKDEAYVDITDNLTFLEDDSFIWSSEKDGWNHIYLYNEDGKQMNQITKGEWEVTSYYGYDQNEDKIYYQSTENGSINRGVYNIGSGGDNKKALATDAGTNNASFSTDFTYFINTYSSAEMPPVYTLHKAINGKKVKDIKENNQLLKKLEGYVVSPKEFSTIAINGNDLNMYMIKPKDFDPSKKYPLLMYQYSGPGSQNVSNSWMGANDYWHQMLVSEGYIVACVDGRGTGFKGSDFKKVTYMNLVKYETEDQIAVAKKLSELPYIDEDRTGIWGWSFGGHMSTNCLLRGNDVFETAIAVAPVTSWRFYDTIYTERFMRTPAENPNGYDDNSPFNYPELLAGNYLLIHGSGDDNVHVQNSMRMIEALIQANKQFDWGIYPDKNHGIYGGNTRIHLYNKMTNFIKEKL
ncbi:S9 family peptidase [Maribacter hydrothermalis]|uniref:Peptidase S9 n=1 Tax=Maribacter hydrothermalis TaxID=1836467 RepID=A0A1B7YXX4_9FLAO|nr:S9 family peptidase [Maribacter hydrothermalis]APQ16888.1 S9 family peptidase [Maribacter hydrothermalis]OBR35317.1 peptidase S9 [Maribacter hydrothermalis]